MDQCELAYVAGFFDGEGSIGIYHRKDRTAFYLRTQLTQGCTPDAQVLLEGLAAAFGGNISVQSTLSGGQKFNWQLNGDKAAAFLAAILPYLHLKKAQAEVAIRWQANRPQVGRDEKGRIVLKTELDRESDALAARLLKSLKASKLTPLAVIKA